MFACFIAEWREWKRSRMTRLLLASALTLAGVAGFTSARPLILLWAYGAWALGAGWHHGNKYRRGASEWERSGSEGVSGLDAVAGKILASALGFPVCLAFLSPPLALMAFVWAPPASAVLLSAMNWPALYLLGLGAGLSTSSSLGEEGGFIGNLFVFVWFFATILVPKLNRMNPFFETWSVLSGGPAYGPLISTGSTLAIAAILLAISIGAEWLPRRYGRG